MKAKIDALRVVARAYAKRYSGKVKWDEQRLDGLPPCVFKVTGRFRGRPLHFRIFDSGCVVEGETTQRFARGAISVRRKAVGATVPVPLVGRWAPPLFRDKSITDGEARAALGGPRTLKELEHLHLTPDQLVAILPRPYWSNSKEPTFLFIYSDEGGPDFPGLDARLDVLARLFPWRGQRAVAPAVPQEDPVFSTSAHRIRIGARLKSQNGEASHTFGGTLEHELKCRNCRSPMHLLLTIDTRAPGLQLRPLGRRDFRIVYCLNCMSFPGLLYIDYSKPKLRVIRQDKQETFNEDGHYPARKVTLTPLEPATRSASKIGGTPNWIQGPEVPHCARCQKPMAFLAQFKSIPDVSFVDDGTLYTFVCTRCNVSASLVQSH